MDESELRQLDELESTHFWYKARKFQLSRWFATQNLGNQVLDLGSATGGNTLYMESMGFDVTSVEYSQVGVSIQQSKGIPVINADARDLPFLNSSFDVVVCLDVLEHIVEDLLVALEISRVLKPGGRFLISVPEDPNLWSAHDDAVKHVRRYSKNDLLNVVSEAGLCYEDVWSTLIPLRPLIKIVRRFTKGSDLKPVNKVLNFLLYQLCKLEILFPKSNMQGVTLWIHGRKEKEL